jgi:hypothetical protein
MRFIHMLIAMNLFKHLFLLLVRNFSSFKDKNGKRRKEKNGKSFSLKNFKCEKSLEGGASIVKHINAQLRSCTVFLSQRNIHHSNA